MSTDPFRIGDQVTTKYASSASADIWVGEVTAVEGDTVTVLRDWGTRGHHVSVLVLRSTVERAFIPDRRFAADVRRARTEREDSTVLTAHSTVRIRGGESDRNRIGAEVTVWRWEAADGERTDGRHVYQLAKDALCGQGARLERLSVEVFKSEHGAGVASRTVYRVVAK